VLVELYHGPPTTSLAIGLAGVSFRLAQRGVTERRHYVMGTDTGIGEQPAKRFAKPMWLAAER